MTKLTESAIYSPTIFRLETTTPVAGGEVILDGNGDPVQGYANAQAQLLANRTKYLKTITDALGTAATATLTTSTLDGTVGRVTRVGDFGLGAINAPPITNANLPVGTGSGIYALYAPFTNAPAATPVIIIHQSYSGAMAQTAIEQGTSNNRMWVRQYNGSAWLPWVEVWTSAGANTITVDTGSIGYGAGPGGTVIQATSKATGVTLNKPSGRIVTAADSLGAGESVSFLLTNSKVASADVIILNAISSNSYRVQCAYVSAGSAGFSITNITGAPLAEAVYLNFVVIKGAIA